MTNQYDHQKNGYYFDINGKQLLAICAQRANGYALAKAIVDAINDDVDLFCTAHVGRNNDVNIVGSPIPSPVDVEIIFTRGDTP